MVAQAPKTNYHVKAHAVEACNCQHGCNCQFTGFPNEGQVRVHHGLRSDRWPRRHRLV